MEPAPAIDSGEVGGPQGGAAVGQGFEYAKGQREHQSTLEDMPKLEPAAVEVADDTPPPGDIPPKKVLTCPRCPGVELTHPHVESEHPDIAADWSKRGNDKECGLCGKIYKHKADTRYHIRTAHTRMQHIPERQASINAWYASAEGQAEIEESRKAIADGSGKVRPCTERKIEQASKGKISGKKAKERPVKMANPRKSPKIQFAGPGCTCPDCGRVFHHESQRRIHQRTHGMAYHDDSDDECNEGLPPPKWLEDPEELRRAKFRAKFHQSKKIKCPYCWREWQFPSGLKRHLMFCHGNPANANNPAVKLNPDSRH